MEAMRSDSLEALNSNYMQTIASIENLDNKYLLVETKAVKLAGTYLIVQSIIYLQASLSPVACQRVKRLTSLGLIAAVSIAFWLTFTITVRDCLRIKRLRDVRFLEADLLYRTMRSKRSGHCQEVTPAQEMFGKPLAIHQRKRYVYVGIVNGTLLSFTVFVSYVLCV